MRDYLTVLTVRSPQDAVMTKRLFVATNGAVGKKGYDRAVSFDARKSPLTICRTCGTVLLDLAAQPDKVAIRGLPTGNDDNVRRRLTA